VIDVSAKGAAPGFPSPPRPSHFPFGRLDLARKPLLPFSRSTNHEKNDPAPARLGHPARGPALGLRASPGTESPMIARLMGLKTISPGKLDELVRQRAVTVIDVNSPGSWAQSHVPGAVNLDPMNFSESDLPPEKSSPLAFYCSNPFCRKAPNAARRAGKMGYADVRVMSAGISGWIAANLPTEAGAQIR